MLEEKKHPRFSYSDYERLIRAPEYDILRERTRVMAAVFRGCKRVLDIASGQGFFLDSLVEIGIAPFGVDHEPALVQECRERGLEVVLDDALHFLAATSERFDGVDCSHFIEHLEFEAVVDLVEGIRRVLLPGGLLVLRWPNPRSVVMQHLAFWRDPTHVRYYDGQLIQAVLAFYGFDIVETHFQGVEPETYPRPTSLAPPAPAPPSGAPHLPLSLRLVRGFYQRASQLRGLGRVTVALKRRFKYSLVHAPNLRLLLELPLDAQIYARRGANGGVGDRAGGHRLK